MKMKLIEETMSIPNIEKKTLDKYIYILEEIEILKAAFSRWNLLNDVINGGGDPVYRLLSSVNAWNSQKIAPAERRKKYFRNRLALLTMLNCYRKTYSDSFQTSRIEWDSVKPGGKRNFNFYCWKLSSFHTVYHINTCLIQINNVISSKSWHIQQFVYIGSVIEILIALLQSHMTRSILLWNFPLSHNFLSNVRFIM